MDVGFFFSSRRRHTRWPRDWSSDVCSSDLVALRGADEQGTLADRKRRLGSDPCEAEGVANVVLGVPAEVVERRPVLTRPADVLALVFANVATLGWLHARWVLNAACGAYVGMHVRTSVRVDQGDASMSRERSRRRGRSPRRR